jgi:hypothetical protein
MAVSGDGWIAALASVPEALDELLRERGPSRRVIVPDFDGVQGDDIYVVALRKGVQVKLHRIDAGQPSQPPTVVAQDVAAGTKVRRDSLVTLSVR